MFDNDDDGVGRQAVLFDYVDDGVNVELDADDEDRAVCWRQQKRATVDAGVNKELDIDDIVVAKGLVAAEGTSREDSVCFIHNVDNGVNKDDVVSSLRPSLFSNFASQPISGSIRQKIFLTQLCEVVKNCVARLVIIASASVSTVDSKLRNWYLHKYVRCYQQRNQIFIEKQMVFFSKSLLVINVGINIIVARLVVIPSASVSTVDSKLRNWYLHKYVRCYQRRNQICIEKQMVS